ncbi:prefoldin subunit family protein [Stylonychia lemnae]|uniref:Prefoldin subunit family protein n=1 Tax=Stylonychia lemnae TaxID=5949 RepID=A0A078B818_STYLE|nr:prefoldin subunit family protein [Stylonychia lemnae]|eukprot:CDW90655.1 prefoldin subunit family protein [Stylonychia lemnae]
MESIIPKQDEEFKTDQSIGDILNIKSPLGHKKKRRLIMIGPPRGPFKYKESQTLLQKSPNAQIQQLGNIVSVCHKELNGAQTSKAKKRYEEQFAFSERLINRQIDQDFNVKVGLEQKLNEYEKLSQTLIDISKKSTHHVMVPISEVGFFTQGKIKHSNEVLVFLGDNYFVERTAHECQDMINRRKQLISKQLDNLDIQLDKQQNLKDILQESKQTSDNPEIMPDTQSRWTKEGLLDIREEYGDEVLSTQVFDEVQQTIHPQSESIKEILQNKQTQLEEQNQDSDSDDDFKVKYQRLKKQSEGKNKELIDRLKALSDGVPYVPDQNSQNSLNQAPVATKPSDLRRMMQQVAEREETKAIDKPIQQQQQQPKSILKKSVDQQSTLNQQMSLGSNLIKEKKTEPIVTNVVERDLKSGRKQQEQQQQQQQDKQEEERPKRVSKFKQQRMGQ